MKNKKKNKKIVNLATASMIIGSSFLLTGCIDTSEMLMYGPAPNINNDDLIENNLVVPMYGVKNPDEKDIINDDFIEEENQAISMYGVENPNESKDENIDKFEFNPIFNMQPDVYGPAIK